MPGFLRFGLVAVVLVAVNSVKFPDYFKKCKKGADGGKCFVENGLAAISVLTKDGEPNFKLQSLTPIHVDRIELQATPQLGVLLEDVNFTGLEGTQFKEGKIDENELSFKGHLNRLEIIGKYDMNGRILILPVQGKGTCNVTMVDFNFEYTAKLATEERKGKQYFKVEPTNATVGKILQIQRVYWQFDNLFSGDERLGPEMNRFLNENWKDIFGEVQVALEQTAAYSIINYFINGYLHYIPIDELFEE